VGFVVDKEALGQVSPRVLRFSPVNFIPPVPHYTENQEKKLITFITGLHNTPQGCGASVASPAGPFAKKNVVIIISSIINSVSVFQSAGTFFLPVSNYCEHEISLIRTPGGTF
jgi:hypothetical protein